MKYVAFLPVLALLGCSTDPGRNADPVQLSGRVTLKGKPLSDVVLNLQPLGNGVQTVMPVKNGAFTGNVAPGKYTYYVSEGFKASAFKVVPQKFREGSMERQVQVTQGGTLNVALD